MKKVNKMFHVDGMMGMAPKKKNYDAPRVSLRQVFVEDGLSTSQFSNHAGMTEQMNVVNWN